MKNAHNLSKYVTYIRASINYNILFKVKNFFWNKYINARVNWTNL